MRVLPPLLVLAFVMTCAACSSDEPAVVSGKTGSEKTAVASVATMDDTALRAAISLAVREQRLYTPGGNNAIELQLALRERRPDDGSLATALIELEPYAVIAAEQSVARKDFDEARRLIGLIERANGDASALPRLRDLLAAQVIKADDDTAAKLVQAEALAEEKAASALVAKAQTAASAAVAATPPSPVPSAKPTVNSEPMRPAPLAVAPTPVAAPANVSVAAAPARIPTLLRDRAPRYPAMALRRKVEGSVELSFTIKGDGSVADVRVVNATPPGFFEEAAIATSQLWQFEALGRDVTSRRSVNFSLPKPAP